MDMNYSIVRRIWRIIYPPLIFIAIQFVVVAVIIFALTVLLVFNSNVAGIPDYNTDFLVEEAVRYTTEHSISILFFSNIVSLAVFLPIWLKTRKRNRPVKNDNPAVTGLLVAGFFAAFNVIQMVVFALLDVMKYFPSYENVSDLYITDSFAIQLLAIGVAAPVVEELVFRGIIMNRLKWVPVWACVLIQGLMFGIVHLNVFQGLYAFVAGVLLGLVYLKYRSIVYVIVGHMAYNLTSVILSEFSEEIALVVILASVIVLPVCMVFLIKREKARTLITEEDMMAPPYYPQGQQTMYYPQGQWPQYYPQEQQSQYYPQEQQSQYYSQEQQSQYYPQVQQPQYHPQVQQPQYYPQEQQPQYHPQEQQPQYYPQEQQPQWPGQSIDEQERADP